MARVTTAISVLAGAALSLSSCGGNAEPTRTEAPTTIELTSTAFSDGETIPVRHTCDGEGVSPPLTITGLPPGTAALVVLVEDPDAPSGTYVHWVAYDVDPRRELPEDVGSIGTAGTNGAGGAGYAPPCPPRGSHHYVFDVFALDGRLDLPPGRDADTVREAMDGHVLATGRLVGRYREP
jgi:Raf kinase inhibitor-like YbhB/YbcL family protein